LGDGLVVVPVGAFEGVGREFGEGGLYRHGDGGSGGGQAAGLHDEVGYRPPAGGVLPQAVGRVVMAAQEAMIASWRAHLGDFHRGCLALERAWTGSRAMTVPGSPQVRSCSA